MEGTTLHAIIAPGKKAEVQKPPKAPAPPKGTAEAKSAAAAAPAEAPTTPVQ